MKGSCIHCRQRRYGYINTRRKIWKTASLSERTTSVPKSIEANCQVCGKSQTLRHLESLCTETETLCRVSFAPKHKILAGYLIHSHLKLTWLQLTSSCQSTPAFSLISLVRNTARHMLTRFLCISTSFQRPFQSSYTILANKKTSMTVFLASY